MAIELTPVAAQEVLSVMSAQELEPDQTYLRVRINGGGCSGMQYSLAFDQKFDRTIDAMYPQNGVNVVTMKKFAPFLDGTQVDFIDGPMGRGFKVDNPTFPQSAGCAGCHGN